MLIIPHKPIFIYENISLNGRWLLNLLYAFSRMHPNWNWNIKLDNLFKTVGRSVYCMGFLKWKHARFLSSWDVFVGIRNEIILRMLHHVCFFISYLLSGVILKIETKWLSRLGILYRNYVLKLNFSYIKSYTLSKTRNRFKTGRLSYEYSQAEVLRPIWLA